MFSLGRIVTTPGAQEAMTDPMALLRRHARGDWGDMCEEDKKENDLSVNRHLRIMSAYKLPSGITVWIITEADRSVTTFLLPEEY